MFMVILDTIATIGMCLAIFVICFAFGFMIVNCIKDYIAIREIEKRAKQYDEATLIAKEIIKEIKKEELGK